MALKDERSGFWQIDAIMAEEREQDELEDLKALLQKNTEAIEKLRGMIENMEVLLATLSKEKASQSAKPQEQR